MIALSAECRNERLQAIVDTLDSGGSTGYIVVFTAPRPASGASLTTQIVLGVLALSAISGVVSDGELTFNPIADEILAQGDGDIAWARAFKGGGQWVFDLDAGDNASSAQLKFDEITVRTGGIIKITSGSLIEGNS